MTLFLRNLKKFGKPIDIQARTSSGAVVGEADPKQDFATKHAGVLALVKTPKGKATFDDVGLDQVPTHAFVMAWIAGISQEDWVLFNGRRFDILNDLNCCEDDEVLTLFSRERGKGEAAKA